MGTPLLMGTGLFDPIFDPDAEAFMVATGIPKDGTIYYSGTPQQITGKGLWIAINNLVKNLKGIGTTNSTVDFWNAKGLKAFHPFIGGTAFTHKWNLKNPLDTNAAFRLVFSGTWVHGKMGALPDGITAYADTFLSPSSSFSTTSANFGRYNGTGGNAGNGVDMGVSNAGNSNAWACFSNYTASKLAYFTIKNYTPNYSPDDGYGFYCTNRSSTTTTQGFKNGLLVATGAESPITLETGSFYYGALHQGASATFYDNKEIRCGYFMDGLSSGDILVLNSVIDAFQLSLKRANRNAYFFGDSVTAGAVASPMTLGYAYLLSRKFGWIITNSAVSGTTLTSATPLNPIAAPNMYDNMAAIPSYVSGRDGVLFIAYGINDCGLNFANYTTTLFSSQMSTIIDYAVLTKGWPLGKIVIQCATLVNPTNWADYVSLYGVPVAADTSRFLAYQTAAQNTASSKGVNFLNPYQYMVDNGGLALLGDNRHPNNTGHQVVADYDETQLLTMNF